MPRPRNDPSLLREQDVYYCEDVQRILGIGQSKAYQIIRRLNKELEAGGFITIAGRVSSAYFHERVFRRTERQVQEKARSHMGGGARPCTRKPCCHIWRWG